MPLPSSSVQPGNRLRTIVGLRYVPLGRGPSSFREKKQKRRPAGREKEDG